MTFRKPVIVGLTGYATVGKTTVAAELEKRGFVRMSFADGVREMALAIDPIVDAYQLGRYPEDGWDTERLSEVVGAAGWTEAKKNPEVRRILQVVGTEVGRAISPNVWVDRLAAKVYASRATHVVVDDVRFVNEANWIRHSAGGTMVRLHRTGVEAANGHASELEIDRLDVDLELWNDHDGVAPSLIEAIISRCGPSLAHTVDV